MRIRLLCLCVAALVSGCISERHGGASERMEQPAAWQIGRTTAREVVAQWGNPDYVVGETWVWWTIDALGGKFRLAHWGVGLTFSNLRQGMREERLTFGADGRLKAIASVQTLPGGPGWSVNPF